VNISVFLGAPGSGKGTQAKRLADADGFKHFSTGDMLRAAMAAGTETGKKAKAFVDKGDYVPDDVMIELIQDALKPLKQDSKIILDGFPRTLPQAQALDKNPKTQVARAIFFDIPQPLLIERLTGRRTCSKCGEPYHIKFQPPKRPNVCDKCGSPLTQRKDDAEDVVTKRLGIYNNQTAPLIQFYDKNKKLGKIDANKPVDTVYQQLLKLVT
jgi:adenylate kinase